MRTTLVRACKRDTSDRFQLATAMSVCPAATKTSRQLTSNSTVGAAPRNCTNVAKQMSVIVQTYFARTMTDIVIS
jgi:hypothetical protein